MKRPANLRLLTVVLSTLALSFTAMAQESQPERGIKVRPAEERRHELELAPSLPLDRTPVLPPASFPQGRELRSTDSINVKRIVLKDLTLLPEKEVSDILAPYQGRRIAIEELYALRRKLSEAYVRHGYVNSGVVIPDQDVAEGVIVLQEIRGTLTRIDVTGNGHLSPSYITKRIASASKDPLRIQNLQEALELLLQQDQLIQQVNARLSPGLQPGEAELSIAVKRTKAFQVALGANNQGSVSTRGEQGFISVAHLNLLGQGDAISAEAGTSGGRTNGSFAYSFPLTAGNTRLEAAFSLDNSRIIEEPFDQIDIKSETMRGSLSVAHPWIRSSTRTLVTSAGLEKRHSESTLLGTPFSFSLGDQAGKSDTTVINIAAEYTIRTRAQAFSARGSFRQGVDLFNATVNKEGPDGRAAAFLGQLNYARRLGSFGGEFLLRWTGQFAFDPLLAIEKIPIGGLYTVRGYRENLYVRDNGLAASLEYRIPVRLGHSSESGVDLLNFRVAPFFDYGRAWDKDRALVTSNAADIYSAGIGLLWNPAPGIRADVYWGYAFKNKDDFGNSLQDNGVHFTARYLLPF